MRGRPVGFVLGGVLVLAGLPVQPVAAAAGQYTLPAWTTVGRTTGRNYGCVSGTADPFTGNDADGTPFACASFHSGIDFSMSFKPVVSTRAGVVVTVIQTNPDNPGSACVTAPNNMIVIDHGSGQTDRYSRYLHVKQNSSQVSGGDNVSAGQWIATSGNAGTTCGAHLHYGLSNSSATGLPPHSLDPDDKWTIPATSTGRAPWLNDYVSKQASTLYVCSGDTVTTWVKFKNLGGRPWPWVNDLYNRGKVVLYSTNSTGTAAVTSLLNASDWETTSRITPADTPSVAADGTGTFTFGVKGGGTPGQLYALYVNLDAFGLNQLGGFWFKYNDQVKINVQMLPSQGC